MKYVLDEEKYRELRAAIRSYVEPDLFACSEICSLYLDTPDNSLIRRSLEKPRYKEKIRLRAYGLDHGMNSSCFIEIKKKAQGVVYKRRVSMALYEALAYCREGVYPEASLATLDEAERYKAIQVLRELDWCFYRYRGLYPSFTVSCRRLSLKERNSDALRITFDRDIRWTYDTDSYVPGLGSNILLDSHKRVMEVKAVGAMPLWLVQILDELKIYPQSFSKAGNTYKAWLSSRDDDDKCNDNNEENERDINGCHKSIGKCA